MVVAEGAGVAATVGDAEGQGPVFGVDDVLPMVAFLTADAVDDAGFALVQVVMKVIVLAVAAPVAGDPPFVVGLRFQQRSNVQMVVEFFEC